MEKTNVTLRVSKEVLEELRDRQVSLSNLFEFAAKMFLATEGELKK